jgi:hypothetical protein
MSEQRFRDGRSDAKLPIGSGRCLCSGCGRYFSSPSPFDRHQTTDKAGQTVCHDPADRGLVERGDYWGWPSPETPVAYRAQECPALPRGKETNGVEGGDPVSHDLSSDSARQAPLL